MFSVGGFGIAGADKDIIDASTSSCAEEWSHDWDPEIIILTRKDSKAPPRDGGEESRAQVASRVDGIASLVAISSTDECDGETHGQGLNNASGEILLVCGRQNDDEEESRCNKLKYKGIHC